ncbi:unnamed protein product [Hymenolepis diminuta]|uniref:Uncharacterized protein n=1 Tax=Hymenolepis diminuta TaxID=6216 RepID=A0A564YPU4_HYMDI|nr:unnamed protein product [Hymenolepis diminuta]
MLSDVSYTSQTTLPPKFSKNSTQSPVVPVSLKVFSTVIKIRAVDDSMKLYPSVRDSLRTSLTFKPKSDQLVIYMDTCDLHLEIPKLQRHRPSRYSGCFRRLQKRFKVDLKLKLTDKQLSPGSMDKNEYYLSN